MTALRRLDGLLTPPTSGLSRPPLGGCSAPRVLAGARPARPFAILLTHHHLPRRLVAPTETCPKQTRPPSVPSPFGSRSASARPGNLEAGRNTELHPFRSQFPFRLSCLRPMGPFAGPSEWRGFCEEA